MSSRLLIPLLIVGAVALACGTRSHSDARVVPVSSVAKAAIAPMRRTRLTAGTATAVTPSFAVNTEKHGLHFALNVTNPGKNHLELVFPDGQEYDFAVVDAAGHEVYRWGKTRMFTQSRQNHLLDGGDTMRIDETVSPVPALAPGHYTAVGTLRSSNFPVEQRVAIDVR